MRRELKEAGTERRSNRIVLCCLGSGHKAYPDEKGTERYNLTNFVFHVLFVTRHIPMRRELKD